MKEINRVEAERLFNEGYEIWVYSGEYDEDLQPLRYPICKEWEDEFIDDKIIYFIDDKILC